MPSRARRAARAGGDAALRSLEARGQAEFFRILIRGQIAAIRARRAAGGCGPALPLDLALYRRERRRWRERARGAG